MKRAEFYDPYWKNWIDCRYNPDSKTILYGSITYETDGYIVIIHGIKYILRIVE